MELRVAGSLWSRTVGLAFRRTPPEDWALLIPRCRSVHTFGMRFPLDLVWIGAGGGPVRIDHGVRPRRVRTCRAAIAVIEIPAGRARAAGAAWDASRGFVMLSRMAEERPNRWLEAFNPRVPLYRDSYNEYLVFIVSAIGAVAGTQVPLYILMALTDLWDWWVFVAACVIFELAVIFLVTRPQMKPRERVGWALLWAFATGLMALAFYYLVAEPTL